MHSSNHESFLAVYQLKQKTNLSGESYSVAYVNINRDKQSNICLNCIWDLSLGLTYVLFFFSATMKD